MKNLVLFFILFSNISHACTNKKIAKKCENVLMEYRICLTKTVDGPNLNPNIKKEQTACSDALKRAAMEHNCSN